MFPFTNEGYELAVSFPRAIRYKGIYRFNMSAFKTMNPFEFSPYNHTLGGGFKGVHRFIVSNLRER